MPRDDGYDRAPQAADHPVHPSSVVRVSVSGGEPGGVYSGSGVLLADGLVITAGHVISGGRGHPVIKASDGKRYAANVLKLSINPDVAFLRIRTPADIVPAELGSNSLPDDDVTSYGFPYAGSLVPVQREVIGYDGSGVLLVTRTSREGESGGPVFGAAGRVRGIVRGRNDRDGYSYCTSANTILSVGGALLRRASPGRRTSPSSDAPEKGDLGRRLDDQLVRIERLEEREPIAGADGASGNDGPQGVPGPQGEPGRDGVVDEQGLADRLAETLDPRFQQMESKLAELAARPDWIEFVNIAADGEKTETIVSLGGTIERHDWIRVVSVDAHGHRSESVVKLGKILRLRLFPRAAGD